MQKSNPRVTSDGYDELLACRMEMLGLDFGATEAGHRAALGEIQRQCAACGYREACDVDLQRDPNNPVWESYCPNAGALIDLAKGS